MASTDQVAGHPIAIRVGGRRMSQSNPIRSPTKTQQQSTPASSPEDAGSGTPEVPDYPRPRAPDVKAETGAEVPTAERKAESGGDASDGCPSKHGEGNRQERRRHERRREKSHHDEQQQGNNNGSLLSSHNDALFNHLHKGAGDRGARQTGRNGTAGVRITQPTGKFLA